MITLDVWQIRHRYATEKISKRELAKQLGVSRGTVDRALEAERPPKYERMPAGSSVDVYAPQVRAWLVQTPTMPASVLAERVGWTGSASLFRDKVRAIRPEYLPADPVDRLVHEPGQAMQCDLWFPHEPLPLGHGQEGKPPVLVMTSAFSGYIHRTRNTSPLSSPAWTPNARPPGPPYGSGQRSSPHTSCWKSSTSTTSPPRTGISSPTWAPASSWKRPRTWSCSARPAPGNKQAFTGGVG